MEIQSRKSAIQHDRWLKSNIHLETHQMGPKTQGQREGFTWESVPIAKPEISIMYWNIPERVSEVSVGPDVETVEGTTISREWGK